MSGLFGLGFLEIVVLLVLAALIVVPAVILLIVLRPRSRGPAVGEFNALLAENEGLRDEVARLRQRNQGANPS